MSKKLTLEEFKLTLPTNLLKAIEIIDYSHSTAPITFKILATGEIRTATKACSLKRNITGTFKPLRGQVWNSITTKEFQEKIDKKFGPGLLFASNYTNAFSPVTIECTRCHNKKEYFNANSVLNRENACVYCDKSNFTKEEA